MLPPRVLPQLRSGHASTVPHSTVRWRWPRRAHSLPTRRANPLIMLKCTSTSTPISIGQAAPIAWPPHSPDLKLLDFFLWGFVKYREFVPLLPANVAEFRMRITTAVAEGRQRCYVACGKTLTTGGTLPHYQWKSHRTITIRGKTWCVLLYYDI
jgi:hypothetical protein